MSPEKLAMLQTLFPFIAILASLGIGGWVITTWLRIKNGYPLDGQWGQALYPKRDDETIERVKLLTQENAGLRAELGSIKDRLQNVERIVTDSGNMLSHEIENLRDRAN
ncbi:hypothetical protein M0208_17535 [Sphingomonas sp. SUN019]|uniref:hypothetical protein n=1 Tax=Sphingomonas sp. SUN019 TaxID=2937788 RepID=UPI0021641243|nr:hypothetical protein [Sphingomonas sp. SUN019]UVO52224.1 hypothetical protein M0208_17535 [Sphingomonas sp. SUN019]